MDINRNQWFMIGVVVLLIGLQFRMVRSYTLNAKTTQFLAERSAEDAATDDSMFAVSAPTPSNSRKVVTLPEWSGWCLLSVGAVLVLHSLAMKRPD